jgi:hypothetical protein
VRNFYNIVVVLHLVVAGQEEKDEVRNPKRILIVNDE